MSTLAASSSRYEKLVAAGLVALFVLVGWGPFMLSVWLLPYVDRMMLPGSLGLMVFALGLVYVTTERALGRGRGLYAAAIFCSTIACGLVATDPARFSAAGLALVVSLGLWQAVKARGDDRPFFLGMLALLALLAGYAYAIAALPLLAAVALARQQTGKAVRGLEWLPLVCLGAGMLLHNVLDTGLPLPRVAPQGPASIAGAILPWLPWGLFVSELGGQRLPWRVWAVGVELALIMLALLNRLSWVTAAAGFAPVLALLVAGRFQEYFTALPGAAGRRAMQLAAYGAALVLVAVPLLAAAKAAGVPELAPWEAVACLLVAAALAYTERQGLPRWSFIVIFAAGALLGQIAARREPMLPDDPLLAPARLSLPVTLYLLLAVAGLWVAMVAMARRQRAGRVPDRDFRFGGAPFPLTSGGEAFSFAIFGDVTGAESPFSTRRDGWRVWRGLVESLTASQPEFAISLGDLSSSATPGAYGRAIKLLAQLPMPLAVTPGNHDLFIKNEYDAACFHEQYGEDNRAFARGPVRFIVLNNAWGSVDPAQFEWLERELAVPAPHKLVFCHKPPFDFRADAFYAMEAQDHAARLHELFVRHGVTAVFSGHIHTLLHETRDGVTYVISGGGGSKLTSRHDQFHYLSAGVSASELVIRALPLLPATGAPLLELRFSPRA